MDRFRSLRPHALRPTALFSAHAARDVIRPGFVHSGSPPFFRPCSYSVTAGSGTDTEQVNLRNPMATILLVEDNEMNRDMLSRRLERRGYVVICAMDGQQGVELARRSPPDLILMDMSLPVLDGWQATRLIKEDPVTRHIPVIALTAHAMAEDERKARESGCDDYDTKPVELDRLLKKMTKLLEPSAHEG